MPHHELVEQRKDVAEVLLAGAPVHKGLQPESVWHVNIVKHAKANHIK